MMFLQGGADLAPFLSLGVGGTIAVFVILIWRQDRKQWTTRYEEDRKSSEIRFAHIAGEFRTIVQDNTKALTSLVDRLDGVTVICPFVQEGTRRASAGGTMENR